MTAIVWIVTTDRYVQNMQDRSADCEADALLEAYMGLPAAARPAQVIVDTTGLGVVLAERLRERGLPVVRAVTPLHQIALL
jgi:hypothetical protein